MPDTNTTGPRYPGTSGDYDHVLQTCMRWVEVA